MIEVILLERIERLGEMGQTVKVKPGFARNFLLPRKKALRATKSNIAVFEKQRAALEAQNADLRAKAEAVAGKMDGLKIVIIRQAGDSGMMYGSVSSRDVADGLTSAGYKTDRHQVQIDTPIKMLGLVQVKVRLHPEVMIKVTLNVARSAEEAAVQAEKGVALIKAAAAAEAADAAAALLDSSAEVSAEAVAEKPAKAAKKTKKAASEKETGEESPAASEKPAKKAKKA